MLYGLSVSAFQTFQRSKVQLLVQLLWGGGGGQGGEGREEAVWGKPPPPIKYLPTPTFIIQYGL